MTRAHLVTAIFAAALPALSFPVAAQDMTKPDDMTCADFSDLAPEDQAKTIEGFQTQLEAGGMASEDQPATDEMTQSVTSACQDKPDMTVGEAMNAAKGG